MWRELPEKQKKPFEEKAKRLREKWMVEMKKYKANLPEGGYQPESGAGAGASAGADEGKGKKKRKSKKKKSIDV